MRKPSRYMLLTLSILGCAAFVFYSYEGHLRPVEMRRQNLPIATDTITALDNRTFIIAPYYEPRLGRSVRVIAIVHVSVEELYCIFHCSHNDNVFIRAKIDLHRDRFEFPYGTADLLCVEPSGCDYTYMSFSSSNSTNTSQNLLYEVRNHPPQPISANFTVCISTLYGNFSNALQMIQSIEMYKILGASRVTIYNTSCSQDVDKVLRHYIDEGTLEVVPWPIDRHLRTSKRWHHSKDPMGEVGYYGQTATLNDCLYRNMYKSQFILLNDIDEIILPVLDHDWSSLVERLQKEILDASIFLIETHVFPITAGSSEFQLWSHVPGVNILPHNLRQPPNKKINNPRKIIVDPRKVFQTSIHYCLEYEGRSIELHRNFALNFHCKDSRREDITRDDLIRDDILWKYNVTLLSKVNAAIEKIFPL